MIIHTLKLTNFGIYGGVYEFDLRPVPSAQFNRPVVLLRGQNGVGKTTFVEAVRLCLHGQAALGRRTSTQEYETYLLNRIHRPADVESRPNHAKVELVFDYVSREQKHTYRVVRSWQNNDGRLNHELYMWEDEALVRAEDEQKEELLRELVPPGVADLFFFDGEQIRTLADDQSGSALLADTVRSLLGVNMVEQLEKDLDIYISRQRAENGSNVLQEELEAARQKEAKLVRDHQATAHELRQKKEMIEQIATRIAHQEQKLANEGGAFARQREDLKARLLVVETQIEEQRKDAQALCNGLMPFAVAPEMLQAVADRLETERRYKAQQTAQKVLEDQLAQLREDMASSHFWEDAGPAPDEPGQEALFQRIAASLRRTIPQAEIAADDVILHVSDKKRRTLLNWIDQAQGAVPHDFSVLIHSLDQLEAEREHLRAELERVPSDETLSPLVKKLNDLHKRLGVLEKDRDALEDELSRLEFWQERTASQLRGIREQIAEHEAVDERVRMAARTQSVLEAFAQRLTQAKVAQLEEALVKRFNQLVRKQNFVSQAKIDPKHFTVTFYRAGGVFERTEFSAGERQLLAIATMWALREVSGRPAPVIIDTPLSRLDTEHRLSMVQSYLPHVSHQVLVLATDAEMDEYLLERLKPAVSHIYHLSDDPETGRTHVELERLPVGDGAFVQVGEVGVKWN